MANRITAIEADIIDRMDPAAQQVGLGAKVKDLQDYSPVIFAKDYTADFSTATEMFTAPFAMHIDDIIVNAQATEGSGTVLPSKGADALCTAIACATDGAVTHMSAGAVVANKARMTLAAGNVVKMQAVGGTAANIRAHVTVLGHRI